MGRKGEKGSCLPGWVFRGLEGVHPVLVSSRRKHLGCTPGPRWGVLVGGGSGQVPGPEVDFWPIPTLLSLSQSSLGLATVVGVSDS